MSLIITRGFGKHGYVSVSVCTPDVVSHEYGLKYMEGEELKPKIKTKIPPYVYKEIEE